MVRDWLLGLDPGYQRLRRTLRALLSIIFSVAAIYGIGRLLPISLAAMMLSGMTAMLASMNSEENRRERVLTTVLLPLPLVFAASVAAFTNPLSAWIGYGVLIVILYGAVEARRFGGRGTVLGMACVIAFFLARFIGVTTSQLAGVMIGLVLAAALSILVREIVVPTAPRATLHWAIQAFRAQERHAARLMMKHLDGKVTWWGPTRSALKHLNICALAVNTALDSPDAGIQDERRACLRAAFIDSELVVERCAMALERNANADLSVIRAALEAILRRESKKAKQIAHTLARPRAPHAQRSDLMRVPPKHALPVQTKQAIQATVASAAAIAVGQWLSPTRWYWAMLAAFVVFVGTSSSGETLRKIWARVLGTALGAGVAVASLAGTDLVADAVIMLALVAIGLYLQPISYASMTFCITVVLGLVYTAIGQSTDKLLTLRLEETAVGAFFGGLAATMILPVHTKDAISVSIRSYVEAIDEAVTASVDALAGEITGTAPKDKSRALDGQLHDLLARSQPMLNGLPFVAPPQAQRDTIAALASCSYYARHLARVSETAERGANDQQTQIYRDLQGRIRKAIGVITGKTGASDHALKNGAGQVASDAAAHDLTQIADILMRLSEEPPS